MGSMVYGARAASLWIELGVMDAQPGRSRTKRRLLVLALLLAAPVLAPAVLVVDLLSDAFRRALVVWW